MNWMFHNTIRILGFIALAIYFDKWWLVFFALLFLIIDKKEEIKND